MSHTMCAGTRSNLRREEQIACVMYMQKVAKRHKDTKIYWSKAEREAQKTPKLIV